MKQDTRPSRRAHVLVRALVSLLSVAVLGVTAVAWVQLRALDRSTPTAAVIDGAPTRPTAEQNILLVGLDSRTDAQGNPLPPELLDALHAGDSGAGGDTADTLMVVHVPAGGGRATAISIPRDSYVQLAGGLGNHKINSAYARASREATLQMTGGAGGDDTSMFAARSVPRADPNDPAVRRAAAAAGARATIATVEQLTGLGITHYAAVNLAGFAEVSRAIGGVPVCLRAPVDDPYSGLTLPAGPQEVSGAQALAFVRQRHGLPHGDLDRIRRQQVFLAGATERLLSTGTLTDPFAVARLTEAVSRSVTLDAGWDILGFARQMQGLSAGAVTFRTIPTGETTMSTPSDGSAVEVNPWAVRSFISRTLAEAAGAPATVAASAPAPVPSSAAVSRAASSSEAGSSEAGSSEAGEVSTTPQSAGSGGTDAVTPAQPPPPTPPISAAAPGCVN